MRFEYVFFEEDTSFDYLSPFGTKTHHCKDLHGFEIEISANDEIDLSTIKGLGAFADVENCKSLEELYDYIEKNKKYVKENENEITIYSRLELLLELQQIILSNLKENVKKGIKTDTTNVCVR